MKNDNELLIASDIKQLIETSKSNVAVAVNSEITLLYWKVGKRINEEVLKNTRAEYGKQVVSSLAKELVFEYGRSFSDKNLRRMMQFAVAFPDEQIVVSAIRQLSWTHFIALIPIKDPLQREFYLEIGKIEGWSVKTLREGQDAL